MALPLHAAGWPYPAYVFWAALVSVSALAGALAAFVAMQWGVDPLASFALVTFLSGVLIHRLPALAAARSCQRLESQVGSLLRLLAVRLSFEPFELALQAAASQPARPHPVLACLAQDVRRGLPTLSALHRLSNATSSALVKKAAMQLSFCYRQGDASALSSLADEFSQVHACALQRFSARTSFASVWFETSAALLPLLLSAYLLVGTSFLRFTFSPSAPFWLLALVLPLVNAVLVATVFLGAPEDA